jgi:hypothetical protein
MPWPKAEQLEAEKEWFRRTTRKVAEECGGSLTSGRRTAKRNTVVGGHRSSLHMKDLAEDWVFDTAQGAGRAWVLGRSLGLHGYKMSEQAIHWQARPKGRK